MAERCAAAHAKLLAGTCPWCGRIIINSRPVGDGWPFSNFGKAEALVSSTTSEIATNLTWMVKHRGPMEYEQAVCYVLDVASELVEIHRKQPLHGSIHPSNIFLDEDGAHLGTLPPVINDSTLSEAEIVGVADCLAPEQALGSSVDGRADIYSLGCTLYFLLAGRPPFPNGSISERLLKHQTATPESLSSLRLGVPLALVQICEKMMAKAPNDRYATAKDVADVIAKLRKED